MIWKREAKWLSTARDVQGLPPVPLGDKPRLPDNQVQPK
jgi:hypothetical protein